ncbi:YhcN/YlaJ family sporulation lipoprotein [Alkalihalobacillus deserti]|uniref:YhcN/YlaJ family sporulation lipoprotein n=1 Tax=Alkalihalobacillus deserti TaxID=2879466 RepID=UPI001D14D873|nr:YhcN/YlaJ family sporulation lipoprotein [Alkalihalobacillus deserti]
MRKIAISVTATTILLGGLAGCGGDNLASNMGANNQTGLSAQDMYVGRNTDTPGQNESLFGNQSIAGQTGHIATGQGGSFQGNIGQTGLRTTGQDRIQAHGGVNYHKDYDEQTVQRIGDRIEEVDGVEEAYVIVHDDDVVIGITANAHIKDVKKEVERRAKGLAEEKEVWVVTDQDVVSRIRTMDNQLRAGTAFEEIGATYTDMLGDLHQEAQRPFERSR